MLSWTIRQLCDQADISESSIRRVEAGFGVPENVSGDLLEKLQDFFEDRGFVFDWNDNNGPGVYWRNYPPTADQRVAG